VTAIDYNPVAWFILKCTLEFPQKLAGKTWPLPTADDRPQTAERSQAALLDLAAQEGDLAAHVRYWGNWVLERAREELAPYYPTIDGKPTVAYLWGRTNFSTNRV
jgi:adenine-specific DNA methylase